VACACSLPQVTSSRITNEFALVDLPGLVHNDGRPEAMAKRFLAAPDAVAIVVAPAAIDDIANSKSYYIAREADPSGVSTGQGSGH
jgi:hypothetical protein